MESGNSHKTVDRFIRDHGRVIKVYNTTRLDICLGMQAHLPYRKSCFKLLFSFHPEHRVLRKLSSGLYNCSVEDYWRFQQHLDNNMKVECEDGRDVKEQCLFSSPVCKGLLTSCWKCFKQIRLSQETTHNKASHICWSYGLEPVAVKTMQDVENFKKLYQGRDIVLEQIGLVLGSPLIPFMYRHVFSWIDRTVIYNANHVTVTYQRTSKDMAFQISGFDGSRLTAVQGNRLSHLICEKPAQAQGLFAVPSVEFSSDQHSPPVFKQRNQPLLICPEGHVTHTFLSRDPKSRCGQTMCFFFKGTSSAIEVPPDGRQVAPTVALYSCTSSDTQVSYSLLCDFRQDCADNSDESFCRHPACKQLSCKNGQCLSSDKQCDSQADCLDGSDEENYCPLPSPGTEHQNQNKSFLINLDGRGYFTQQVMNLTDPCPGTHYRCTKEWFYCLPIYTRCNGVFDCVFREDERDCEGWTCPGLYRCRDSTVCVHADHMCDGWPQCPQRDDEWLCDMTCPAQCLCQGHAFLCPQPFFAHGFPELRYLDARGSGMTPFDLKNNTYIMRLSLARCSITFLPDVKFPNLLFLDLGHNKLTSLVMNVFMNMPNVHTLILKWNPLISITTSSARLLWTVRIIDVSGTHLDVLDSDFLLYFPRIQQMNMSFLGKQSVDSRGLQKVSHLTELDIRGTIIKGPVTKLFPGLKNLNKLYASSYRYCCKEVLPKIIPPPSCVAPEHFLSSCEDMLQCKLCTFSLWCVAFLAGLGNLACFAAYYMKSLITIPYEGSAIVFMASLQCADFCMGIYASVIVAAQGTLHGQYVQFEDTWTKSVLCNVAGFLSLLSCEVSVLVIFLFTLNHVTIPCSPLTTYWFSKESAAVACGVTWFVGILLASLPLLPALSHWGRYDQTAVCSLFLQDRDDASQQRYSIDAIHALNALICVVVSVFQVIIYEETPQHRLLVDQNRHPVYTSVDLLRKMAAIKATGWITAITASVLVVAGVAELQVNVFMAVMVLPLNSAVNPVLCLWHAVTYRQRQKQEERLLNMLKSRRKYTSEVTTTHRTGRREQ